MANPDRLTALDSTFLHLEDDSTAHMHVASVMVFEGKAPTPQELVDHVAQPPAPGAALSPAARLRAARPGPAGVDRRPALQPALPHPPHRPATPADDAALKQLAGRLFSQRLDRSKPLWEIWLVQRMAGERFALIAKTHHALVDGISGVDITTVLFDTAPEPAATVAPAGALDGPAAAGLGEAARRGAARAHDRARARWPAAPARCCALRDGRSRS